MAITIEQFGLPGTPQQEMIRIRNTTGSHIALLPVGARLVEAHFPDRNGELADIVLGFDTIEDYLTNDTYAGAIVGRYANRIVDGRFELHGKAFQLECNEGPNHIHGGIDGLDRQHWNYTIAETDSAVTFAHHSPDGHGGYPGALDIAVTYRLSDDNVLSIDMTATTTAPTVLNLVQHAYWNLAGHASGSVLNHTLMLESATYVPVDKDLLATGEILSVIETPFDFTEPRRIGERIHDVPTGSGAGRLDTDADTGFDHNWILNGHRHDLHLAAIATDPASGRRLTLDTTEPGVQLYTAGYMNGLIGKGGATYNPGAGFTLETQTFPCAPNIAYFPDAILEPNQTYRHSMRFTFDTAG